ncbi:hypothetical protein H9Q10_07215 [Eikenella sp. S3360]|uniref:Uncharacterized protein n=1 Tax=Eikenella glucosivorans TaxID=2766967 RepID=A0ABS0NB29_9NEIS|nr:hypothetical protein [Eikenella glucosivorans]MBH5329454.1 hypothetical protein [Eikenella glucosivorans]
MNHFSAIGLHTQNQDDLIEFINRCIEQIEQGRPGCQSSEGQSAGYHVYTDPSGAQLWIITDQDGSILTVEPGLAAQSTQTIGIQGSRGHEDGTGDLHVWINGNQFDENGACISGDYPLLFSQPDFQTLPPDFPAQSLPARLYAIAEEAECFESPEAYEAMQESQPEGEIQYAANSIIPTGLFVSENDPDAGPQPTAFFNGTVTAAETRTNQLSGQKFYWCRLATYCMEIEAVFPLEMLEHAPAAGNLISGHYWLGGRIEA